MINLKKLIKYHFRRKGFSLLEILIALAVMLVGIVGIMILFPVGLKASRIGETYTKSSLLGHQIIEWLKLYSYSDLDSGIPTTSGIEDGFSWSRTISNVSGPCSGNLKEIKVTISWKEGGTDRSEDYYTYISNY